MYKRIGLIGDNSIEFLRHLLKIWEHNDCAVIVDWRIPWDTVQRMFEECGVVESYIDSNYAKNIQIDSENIKLNFFDSIHDIECVPNDVMECFQERYSHDEALILFSSGTTGKSKGVILTHYAINTNANAVIKYMHFEEKDCIYIIKTLAHSSTIVGELLVGLKKKARIYIAPTILSASTNLEKMQNIGATVVCMNPTVLQIYVMTQKIKHYNLQVLRTIYVSGSILAAKDIEDAKRCFENTDIFNVYGLTEAGPRVTAQSAENESNKPGSVGRAIAGVRIKVLNEQGSEATVNEKGLVCVSTPSISKGYADSSIEKKTIDKEWINTGDIGYIDEDGELFITGRADNMILVSSHNVYPEEIEDYINTLDGVVDCTVLSQKDHVYGEKLCCYYVSSDEINAEKLREFCKKRLSSYEIPASFVKVDKLITNINGKKIRNISKYQNRG